MEKMLDCSIFTTSICGIDIVIGVSIRLALGLRGKGIGSFAEFSVLRIVFDELQLQKLCGEVLASNLAVLNMHKKFGFVQEGLFRKHVLKGGDFADVVCISILREEWDAKKAEIELKLRVKGVI